MAKRESITTVMAVEQRTVIFYDDELFAVRAEDGNVYVAIRQMCQALGIDAQPQRRRMIRTTVLAKGLKGVANLATPGGLQQAYVLRIDLVPLWLSGIRTKAVREDVRPKLERFQDEAAKILWEAFQDGRLRVDSDFEALLVQDTPEVQAYQMAMAVVKLARQQILLRTEVDRHDLQLHDHRQRLDAVEAELGKDERFITQSQAMEVSQAVKAVALALGKRSRGNEFGGVYGELYRVFGIPSYRELPASEFDTAIAFLNEWLQSLISDSPF